MDNEKIRERIRKLLALSKSPNENEAMAAMEKANDLLREIGLTQGDVLYSKEETKGTKRDCPWRMTVLSAVGWLNGCICGFSRQTGSYFFVGPDINVMMSKEMYEYLIRSIERITSQTIRKSASQQFKRSFKYGAAININARIHELGEKARWFDRVEQLAAIDKYCGQLTKHEVGEEKNSKGLVKGYHAASCIGLNRQATGSAPVQIGADVA
jgi:hypothetical protein